jgi:hypothetical protein
MIKQKIYNMKRKLLSGICLLALIIFFIGCAKDTLVENPPNLMSSNSLYSSLEGYELGLNGLYGLVREARETTDPNEGTADEHTMKDAMFMVGTDVLVTNHINTGFCTTAMTWKGNNNAADHEFEAIFAWLYSIINSANTIVDEATLRPNINWNGDSNKDRIISEARALRAWAYRYLTYGWGDVPLTLHESSGSSVKTDWERTPVADVRRQIVSDLLFAEKNIPVEPVMRGRITKGAVQHYLAEMYLIFDKPDSALFWANQAINTPNYSLITRRYGVNSAKPGVPFMDMFYDGNTNREEGNTEALWVFQFAQATIGEGLSMMKRYTSSRYWKITLAGVTPLQITVDRSGLGYGRMAYTKWALNLFEKNDDRGSDFAIRKYFVLQNDDQNGSAPADRLPAGYAYGDTIKLDWSTDITASHRGVYNWPFPRKFETGTDPNNPSQHSPGTDQIYLRLASTYLLKAEAEFLLGRSDDAATTLNIIRKRSNASAITASQVNMDFILDERARELSFEEDRRNTLLRTDKWLVRTALYNHNGGAFIAERDKLYPIPQSVIDANLTQKMPQNPGYN